jgi:hypothetical protein
MKGRSCVRVIVVDPSQTQLVNSVAWRVNEDERLGHYSLHPALYTSNNSNK